MRRPDHHDQIRHRPVWKRRLAGIAKRSAAGLLALAGTVAAANVLGAYLIVRDPLQPAQAIVVLAGGFPTREWEAASVYLAGWAPRVVLVREWLDDPTRRMSGEEPTLEDRRALLVHLGVPDSAIVVADQSACMTADELQAASRMLTGPEQPVILVTSKYHARRVSVLWRDAAGSGPRGLVQPATGDPFAPSRWFLDRRFIVRVAREYVGLVSARLSLPTPTPPCGEGFVRLSKVLSWLVN